VPAAEPLVRIRCPLDDEARARAALARAGLEAERVLTWLVVRDAEPDRVNEALVAGGATVRTVVRERIGQLVGWLLDRQGKLDGRGVNVQTLVRRVLDEGGYGARYAARPIPELLASAAGLHEELMASGAAMVTWPRFLELFCEPERQASGSRPQASGPIAERSRGVTNGAERERKAGGSAR
jgi:hypothetical protein